MFSDHKWLVLASLVVWSGCDSPSSTVVNTPASREPARLLLSVTSDANENPQSVDMAMKLAGFGVDEGRQVVLFFNVKGVTVPSKMLADEFAYQENDPVKTQLTTLIQRGVDVHVCPICMKALNVQESDLMAGAKVTTRASLFANIGTSTAVFTY